MTVIAERNYVAKNKGGLGFYKERLIGLQKRQKRNGINIII